MKGLWKIIFMLCISMDAGAACTHPQFNALQQQFKSIKIIQSAEKMIDDGKVNTSKHCRIEAWPHNTEETSALVRYAYQHNIAIRVIGNAHSHNGSALPEANDLLLHTDLLNRLQFNQKGEVKAGAGIPIYLADQYIRKNSDYRIPVINGGGLAPTIGGFISAGGMGDDSVNYGGFWNNVNQITLVIQDGNVLTVKPDDKLFKWLFGSMGQLGVIVEATLKVIPKSALSHHYPKGTETTISYQHLDRFNDKYPSVYWFDLLIPKGQLSKAKSEMHALQSRYPDLLNNTETFYWPVYNNKVFPPLIYPAPEDFDSFGVWGSFGKAFSYEKLLKFEKEFSQLVEANHYRRYIQTEITASPEYYKKYFGTAIYDEFFAIKKEVDPKLLFGRNHVFAA